MARPRTQVDGRSGPPPRGHAEALREAALAGDMEAREELARLCLPRVRRTVVLALGGGPDADDVVQTAMASVFGRLASYRGEATLLVWVDRVSINAVRDHFRRRRWTTFVRFDEEAPIYQQIAPSPAPDAEVASHELFQRLASHIGKLKPTQRLPVVLSLVHGYSVREIADLLDLRFEATKKRLLRGRRALMTRLQRDPRYRDLWTEVGR